MVDMQVTPDSAVSPTYTGLQTFHASRYDVDTLPISLDPFYYATCPPVSSLIPAQTQTADGRVEVHTGVYPVAAAARLHHGSNKRPKYPAVEEVVTPISFARTDNHHHLPCQQSTQQAWNSGSAISHGTNTGI